MEHLMMIYSVFSERDSDQIYREFILWLQEQKPNSIENLHSVFSERDTEAKYILYRICSLQSEIPRRIILLRICSLQSQMPRRIIFYRICSLQGEIPATRKRAVLSLLASIGTCFVKGLGFMLRVQGLGFRVQGLGFRVKVLGQHGTCLTACRVYKA